MYGCCIKRAAWVAVQCSRSFAHPAAGVVERSLTERLHAILLVDRVYDCWQCHLVVVVVYLMYCNQNINYFIGYLATAVFPYIYDAMIQQLVVYIPN